MRMNSSKSNSIVRPVMDRVTVLLWSPTRLYRWLGPLFRSFLDWIEAIWIVEWCGKCPLLAHFWPTGQRSIKHEKLSKPTTRSQLKACNDVCMVIHSIKTVLSILCFGVFIFRRSVSWFNFLEEYTAWTMIVWVPSRDLRLERPTDYMSVRTRPPNKNQSTQQYHHLITSPCGRISLETVVYFRLYSSINYYYYYYYLQVFACSLIKSQSRVVDTSSFKARMRGTFVN